MEITGTQGIDKRCRIDNRWKKSPLQLTLELEGWEFLGNEVRWNPYPLTGRFNDNTDFVEYTLLAEAKKREFEANARTEAEKRLKQTYKKVRFEEQAFDVEAIPLSESMYAVYVKR